MKNKNIILLFVTLLIIIFVIGFFAIKYAKNKKEIEAEEFIPQEEISEDQTRETIVTLYFLDKESNLSKPEARLVNVKELLNSPYNVLIELLLGGPKNEKLQAIIPENTQLLNSTIEGECLTLDFSKELLNYSKEKDKTKEILINSIVNTVTELNEVNKVKFLIEGQENEEFEGEYVRK